MAEEKDMSGENALQRVARLQKRPSLLYLEKNLFPTGPQPGEIVEIYGDCSTGKTFLLLELIKKCILPYTYKGRMVGGMDAGVILLNTDLHFNISTLVKLLTIHLQSCFSKRTSKYEALINEMIENSLKKLSILNVYNSETLHTTFYIVQRMLTLDKNVSLIALDSISAFYWQDRAGDGTKKMDSYVLHILKSFHQIIHPFKVTMIFTRPSYFQTKNNMPGTCSAVYELRNINTSINLKACSREGSSSHIAEVHTADAFFVKFYSITNNGLFWST